MHIKARSIEQKRSGNKTKSRKRESARAKRPMFETSVKIANAGTVKPRDKEKTASSS